MYLFSAKTTLISRSLFSLLVILAASSTIKADIHVYIPGVAGESADKDRESWIQCDAAQFAVSRSASAQESKAGATTGKALFSELSLGRRVDASSPYLMIRAANGKLASEAIIEFTQDGFVYLRIELGGVGVTGYSVSADGDEIATEQVRLTFSRISMTHYLQGADGRVSGGYTRSWSIADSREF